LAFVAAWNAVACRLIVECKNFCESVPVPEGISSTFSRIAYIALGPWGVRVTDFSIIVTLLGVCIAYQITFAGLIAAIPGNVLSVSALSVLSGIILIPLCISKDVGHLAPFSFLGLVCLLVGIFAILVFGMQSFGHEMLVHPFDAASAHYDLNNQNTHNSPHASASLSFFPLSITDTTIFMGIATFCYGLTTLAFPIEESMEKREEFQTAVHYSLIFVWIIYVFIGNGAAMLYHHDPNGIHENILMNLPPDSYIASTVRLMMGCVCILSFPLTFVPPTQMLEYLIQHYLTSRSRHYQIIYEGMVVPETPLKTRLMVRIALVMTTTFLAAAVPCFGVVSYFSLLFS
jgi:amino acid permease